MIPRPASKKHIKRDNIMKATAYLKEASGLIGLFVTVYLWSLVAMALQS
jgi:hypothetical protein